MSKFKPCIIIPVYNHAEALKPVVARLAVLNMPCILVNDGSEQQCSEQLRQMSEQHSWLSLLQHTQNRGKGAAVCDGLRAAHAQGYSHALQVDADGQHELDDLPAFLEAAANASSKVITGRRTSINAPSSRKYGRMLTDGLVWLEMLSTSVHDSMCGYRVYPLHETAAFLARASVGQRMDFDTDILVRLYWYGLDIEEVNTTVTYADDIPSHFRMFRDNARMTKMHIMLVLGMVLRIPKLLLRKVS